MTHDNEAHISQNYDPQMTVTITAAAQRFFLDQLAREPGALGIRVSVKESGCSGYAYVIEPVHQPPDDHLEVAMSPYAIYVDKQAITVLAGSEIDLVKEGINETIQFNNPNARNYCGCGESFTLE